MANETFQLGDVVELKSGGPKNDNWIIRHYNSFLHMYEPHTHTMNRQIDFYLTSLKKPTNKAPISGFG